MKPNIAELKSIEVIRDGGSLAAIFLDELGDEYWLFLKNIWGNFELPQDDPERYIYPILGNSTKKGKGKKITIQYSLEILEELKEKIKSDKQMKLYKTYKKVLTAKLNKEET